MTKHLHGLIAIALLVGILTPCISYSQVTAYGYYDPASFGGGIAFIPHKTSLVLGLDFGTDGVLMKTKGSYHEEDNLVARVTPGLHVNLEGRKGSVGMTVMGMLGARRTGVECREGTEYSYLDLRCYADIDPDYTYGVAYGFMAMFHYKATIGFRITDKINTIVIGWHF